MLPRCDEGVRFLLILILNLALNRNRSMVLTWFFVFSAFFAANNRSDYLRDAT